MQTCPHNVGLNPRSHRKICAHTVTKKTYTFKRLEGHYKLSSEKQSLKNWNVVHLAAVCFESCEHNSVHDDVFWRNSNFVLDCFSSHLCFVSLCVLLFLPPGHHPRRMGRYHVLCHGCTLLLQFYIFYTAHYCKYNFVFIFHWVNLFWYFSVLPKIAEKKSLEN